MSLNNQTAQFMVQEHSPEGFFVSVCISVILSWICNQKNHQAFGATPILSPLSLWCTKIICACPTKICQFSLQINQAHFYYFCYFLHAVCFTLPIKTYYAFPLSFQKKSHPVFPLKKNTSTLPLKKPQLVSPCKKIHLIYPSKQQPHPLPPSSSSPYRQVSMSQWCEYSRAVMFQPFTEVKETLDSFHI